MMSDSDCLQSLWRHAVEIQQASKLLHAQSLPTEGTHVVATITGTDSNSLKFPGMGCRLPGDRPSVAVPACSADDATP